MPSKKKTTCFHSSGNQIKILSLNHFFFYFPSHSSLFFARAFRTQIPTSDPSTAPAAPSSSPLTNGNDVPPKTEDNLVGILKNGTASPAALTNGLDKGVNGADASDPSRESNAPAHNGIIRRNSSNSSLRQFVNSTTPLIEEKPDEEEEKDQNLSEDNDDEDLSENPVRT